MLVIAVALVLIAAACAAVLVDATRSMLPGVSRTVPVTVLGTTTGAEVPLQRTPETSPDAQDAAGHRAYGFVAALPAEPRTALRATL